MDYEAKLSVEEFQELHEHFKPYANEGLYKTEGWQKRIKEKMEALDSALKEDADEFSHFIVGLYEWSSGM